VLKHIYTDTPFLEALKRAPSYIQFLRKLPSRKGEHGGASMVPIREVCSSILRSRSPSKLQDPGSFYIPCAIGDLQIKRALCDLGSSMSLMPLSLYRRLQLQDLKPTSLTIQLADCSIKQPVGILEDVPIQVGKFVIPCDFVIMGMDENSRVPIILGRPF